MQLHKMRPIKPAGVAGGELRAQGESGPRYAKLADINLGVLIQRYKDKKNHEIGLLRVDLKESQEYH